MKRPIYRLRFPLKPDSTVSLWFVTYAVFTAVTITYITVNIFTK